MNEVDLSANDRVNAWLLAKYRDNNPSGSHLHTEWFIKRYGEARAHLSECPDATIAEPTGSDGSYGCDTGCEYARLECTVQCSHGFSDLYEYGEFGELADMLADIDAHVD